MPPCSAARGPAELHSTTALPLIAALQKLKYTQIGPLQPVRWGVWLQPESGLPRFFEFGAERILNLSASVQSEATRDVQSEAVQSEDAPALARAAWLWSMVALEQQQAGPSSRLSYDGARAISSVDGGYAGTALAPWLRRRVRGLRGVPERRRAWAGIQAPLRLGRSAASESTVG